MDNDLAKMNKNKNGKKYKFPDSFIHIIGHIRLWFYLPYRQKTEGIIKATGKRLPDHPLVIHRSASEELTIWIYQPSHHMMLMMKKT